MTTTPIKPTRVLLIDDDRKFARLIAEYLTPFGYDVTTAHTGPAGVEAAMEAGLGAVILDVMLPEIDGFEVLKRIRAKSKVPVLMLTARGDETDRIVGLEIGADDYVPKTSSARELLARLRAVLRRAAGSDEAKPKEDERFTVGPLMIDVSTRIATLSGAAMTLTPVEFDLMIVLARAGGRVKTREELFDEIRGRAYDDSDRAIDMHISSLRRKLGDDPKKPRFIRTVRTVGYALRHPEEPQG